MGTRCADHVTPLYPQKLALTSPTGGGRSVGIVRVRTKAMEFSLEGVELKDQLLHMYMVRRGKKMTKWYLRIFKRLLNSTVLSSFVLYQVTGRNMQQLSCRIQLVGQFTKYVLAAETRSEPGRQASDNTVQRLTERTFSEKCVTQNWKIKTLEEVYFVLKARKKETFSVLLPNMWRGSLLGRMLWAVLHKVQLLR